MCGITGFFSLKGSVSENELLAMTNSLAHRGPDADGFFYEGKLGLGHRRLSIIDLNIRSNQPFHSSSRKHAIVFNGEIYNYKEIAKELNLNLHTESDTEVIIEAFEKIGPSFIHKLNGMFSFAIYDKEKGTLNLFRDRLGVKPLNYYWDGELFAFSSEIKSLFHIEKIKNQKTINKKAISKFLHLGYIPEPESIYNNIFKLPAGSYAKLDQDGLSVESYWKPEDQLNSEASKDFNDSKKQLNELLVSSIKYRMIADVPFGTFLSGGIDSSIVTAIAQQQSSSPVKTFSIGFSESKFNETKYSKAVSDYLKTDHEEFILSEKEAARMLPDITQCFDEPFADSSAIPTMMVSKLARNKVKMVLSGDGGDELFLGYGAYRWAERLSNPLIKSFRKPISASLSLLSNKYKRAAHLFSYPSGSLKSHIFSQEQYLFSEPEISRLLSPDFSLESSITEHFKIKRKISPAEEQALFDIKYYLKDDLLVKVDRSSMKYSLEVREPLLDYRLVSFALNLPSEFKYKNGISKYILKEVLYDYIPKEYFNRPKWGFSIPLSQWLKKDLNYLVEKYLSESFIKKYGILNFGEVQKLKNRFYKSEDYIYNRIWLIIVLGLWLENNENI